VGLVITSEEQAAIAAADARAAEAKRAGAEAETNLLRLEVGQELDLEPGMSRFLNGATKDEMKADAERLRSALEAAAEPSPKGMNALIRSRFRAGNNASFDRFFRGARQ
jgi:hypothetical protein